MMIARSRRILVRTIFANADQMQNVLGRQIRVTMGHADVVGLRHAPEHNIVTLENARVCQFCFLHRLNCFFGSKDIY